MRNPARCSTQDSKLNTAANPAKSGSALQIFATGYGPLDGSQQAQVEAVIGNLPAQVLYSGPAPGLPGIWQINAQVPAGLTGQVPLFLIAGNIASNAVTVVLQ